MARDFPLDRVVISPSGLLGFSGQKNPIKLGGAVTSNFVPSSSGGGGSSGTPEPEPTGEVLSLFYSLPQSSIVVALGAAKPRRYSSSLTLESELLDPGVTLPIFSVVAPGLIYYGGRDRVQTYIPAPPYSASTFLSAEGDFYAMATVDDVVYAAPNKVGASIYSILTGVGDTDTLKIGEHDPFTVDNPTAMAAVDHPVEECDILFVGTDQGAVIRWGMEAVDGYRLLHEGGVGASSSLAEDLGGRIYGLAPCLAAESHTRLFVSVDSDNPASDDIYWFNFGDPRWETVIASGSIFAPEASGGLGLTRPGNYKNPRGLTVYNHHILFYGMNDSSDVVASISLPHPTP